MKSFFSCDDRKMLNRNTPRAGSLPERTGKRQQTPCQKSTPSHGPDYFTLAPRIGLPML
jgi:hypothetical protein